MDNVIKALIGLAALAFLLAVVGTLFFSGSVLGIVSEAFSRACNNLVLLAIAASVCLKKESTTS